MTDKQMNKTTEALKLAENTLRDIIRVYKFEGGTPVTALSAIREALAEQENQEPVSWVNTRYNMAFVQPDGFNVYECDAYKAGELKPTFYAKQMHMAKQEPVMDYEHICALREGEQNQAEDSYFFVRPENDTPTSRKMFCQGFERGFHKGLRYAAPVERQWVDLTEDEIVSEFNKSRNNFDYACAGIAAFKEKNR